jgi:hypothetical protein
MSTAAAIAAARIRKINNLRTYFLFLTGKRSGWKVEYFDGF